LPSGVALNLRTAEEVRQAGRRLAALPGCDGLLVAEMVSGDRELVCGLTRDPQFGPCVMFGLGHPTIREIDLNPVKIRPDGAPVVVDALIALVPPRG